MLFVSPVWLWTYVAGSLGALWLAAIVYWKSWRFRSLKKLPPGNMGWPIIGELIPYVTKVRSETPFRFTRDKEKQYGPIFKTSLLTGKTIMLTDVAGVKFVLQNEGGMFETGYPLSLKHILGEYAMMFREDAVHKQMHAIVRRFTNSTKLKQHLIVEMEKLTRMGMSTWSKGERMLFGKEIQRIVHDFLMKQLFGLEPGELSTAILKHFSTIMGGIIGLPAMIPGTPYYKAMKAREEMRKIVNDMLAERKAHPEVEYKDILQAIAEEVKEGGPEDMILDNVLINLANGEGVPAVMITIAIKFLCENPETLKRFREENLAIRRGKGPNEGLSWDDYMSLQYTQAVFNETLRLSNGAQGVMRKATRDIEYRGYIIPKGWTVLPYFLNIHFDTEMFPDPTKFEPARWLEKHIPSTYFYPFGGGPRTCPGQELARVQTAVFLHQLVTHYNFKTEPDVIINFPVVRPKRYLPGVVYDIKV